MAKSDKKQVRKLFREACLKRDKYRCVMCKIAAPDSDLDFLDCHHIVSRTELIGGGYVPANGIILCPDCHLKAEQFHQTGVAYPGYSIDELYAAIGSSRELAERKSYERAQKLGLS